MGLTLPRVGLTHSYLCSILAPLADEYVRTFLSARPSWSELKRFAKQHEGLAIQITNYCEGLYGDPPSRRRDVADEVVGFLAHSLVYKKHFQERINMLYQQGLIEVPARCRPKG